MTLTAGSSEHRARIAELEAGLGPFDDPQWRDDLSLLRSTVQVVALGFLADCETIVALAERVPRFAGDERGGTPWTSFVREVAVAKKVSDRAAHGEVALSHALLERHPATVRALRTGAAPAHRARLLVELRAPLPDHVAAVADRLLAERLAALPPWRLKHEVELLALRLDPEGAARQEAVATADRSASITPQPHAQAEIALIGPAPLVQRWWDALTDQARALKAAGDPRSLTALRFDLAVHTDPRGLSGHDAVSEAVGIPDPAAGRAPEPKPEPEPEPKPDVEPAPTAGPTTPGPEDDQTAAPGPEGDHTAAAEACTEPAPAEPASAAPPAPAAPAPGSALGLGLRVRDDARRSRPVQVRIDIPASTALGLSDEPGWLDGYGWISGPLSRRLLACAELRKACVAPHSGQLVGLADQVQRPPPSAQGMREAVRDMVLTPHQLRPTVIDTQPQHDPSPALEAFVHARDRWCDGPTGTATPARRTDNDHDEPWPVGPTRASNLPSRSPRTHQLKHAGWTPVRDATGTTWTSPAGQVAHNPRFDHPPVPPPPGRALMDPDLLAARDADLTQARERDDDVAGRPAVPDGRAAADGRAEHGKTAEPEVPCSPAPRPAARATSHGWPDDPPF